MESQVGEELESEDRKELAEFPSLVPQEKRGGAALRPGFCRASVGERDKYGRRPQGWAALDSQPQPGDREPPWGFLDFPT